jgi:hypothetical protein
MVVIKGGISFKAGTTESIRIGKDGIGFLLKIEIGQIDVAMNLHATGLLGRGSRGDDGPQKTGQ